jgi:hypothetical protein
MLLALRFLEEQVLLPRGHPHPGTKQGTSKKQIIQGGH